MRTFRLVRLRTVAAVRGLSLTSAISPKAVSRAKTTEGHLSLPGFFLHHFNFAVNDYIEAVTSVPLAEDDLAGFDVFAADAA